MAIALVTHIGNVFIVQLQRVAITFILGSVFGCTAAELLDVLIVIVSLLVYISVLRLVSREAPTCLMTLSAVMSYEGLGPSSDWNWYSCRGAGGGTMV